MGSDFRNVGAEVAEGETGETAGVGGKNRGRDHRAFDPHGGNQGKGNGDGAFAETGNILNGNRTFHIVKPPGCENNRITGNSINRFYAKINAQILQDVII